MTKLNSQSVSMAFTLLASSMGLYAQATASGSLNLSSFSATPTTGSLVWSGSWSLDALSSANDSTGGLSFNYDFSEPIAASAAAATTLASASASALAGGTATVTGTASVPAGSFSAAVGSFGN